MSKRGMLLILIASGVMVAVATTRPAGGDEHISLDQIPVKAREALLRLVGGGQIMEIEKDTKW